MHIIRFIDADVPTLHLQKGMLYGWRRFQELLAQELADGLLTPESNLLVAFGEEVHDPGRWHSVTELDDGPVERVAVLLQSIVMDVHMYVSMDIARSAYAPEGYEQQGMYELCRRLFNYLEHRRSSGRPVASLKDPELLRVATVLANRVWNGLVTSVDAFHMLKITPKRGSGRQGLLLEE